MLNTETVQPSVEVLLALTKRIICKYQQRACYACLKDQPLLESDHLCLTQGPTELVNLYFNDAYNSINVNLMNAIFVLDGDRIPNIALDVVKEHFRDEIQQKLTAHMDFVNNGELKVARGVVYLSPLFKNAI